MNLKKILLLALSVATFQTAQADEYLWLYSRSAETLPKGEVEIIFGAINKAGKDSGSYSFWDMRPEIEYGITDRLTVSIEGLIFSHDYKNVAWEPISDTPSFNKTQWGGYEVSLKYNLISPFKGGVGVAVGLAYEHRSRYRLDGAKINQDSFVPTLYLQKNFKDDTLITTLTTKVELENRKSPGVREEEFALDIAAGIAYRFAPGWYIGAEVRYQSDYLNPQFYDEAGQPGFDDKGFEDGYGRSSWHLSDFRWGDQYQYGTYFGPSIHYGAKEWWVTAGILYQIQGGGDKSRNPSIYGGHSWDEHERTHAGFVIGKPF